MKFVFAIVFWLFIFAVLILFIRAAGHQKCFKRRQFRDQKRPSNRDLSAAFDLLTIFQIVCAAFGLVVIVLLWLFGEQFLNLVCGV